MILVLLILVIGGIGIASAETLTGTLGVTGYNETDYTLMPQSAESNVVTGLYSANIESSANFVSLIRFNENDLFYTTNLDTGAPPGAQTSVNIRVSNITYKMAGPIIATGTIGYQQLFNNNIPPVQIGTFEFLTIDNNNWSLGNLNGSAYILLEYNHNALYNYTINNYANNNPTTGKLGFGTWKNGNPRIFPGYYDYLRSTDTWASYSVTKPSGIGISGTVIKSIPNGTNFYNSRVYIFNETGGGITSDTTSNPNPFIFNVPGQPIKIGILSPQNIFYNSSILFQSNVSPILTGQHNITFIVKDNRARPVYYAHISFATSDTGTVLTGRTNESGMLTFIGAPASAAAIVDVTATGFPEYIDTFTFINDMTKTITLASPTISLYLDVKDSSLGYYLDGCEVGIKNITSGVWRNKTMENGAVYFDSTGANYEYPLSINQTVIVGATKAGYRPAWQSVTIPYDRYLVTLNMVNLNGTAPSSGNFTAIIGCTDMQDGAVIIGASITVQELGRIAVTNQGGVATFRNLAVGTYTLQATAPGYQSGMSSITGTDQETAMKNIRLMRVGCVINEKNILVCNGTVVGPGGQGTTGNQSANEKAAGGATAFLNNIVTVGTIVFTLLGLWFIKKIFW